jgi:hypothetical protein
MAELKKWTDHVTLTLQACLAVEEGKAENKLKSATTVSLSAMGKAIPNSNSKLKTQSRKI